MKKSFNKKIIKLSSILVFLFLVFSCASSPKVNDVPIPKDTITTETITEEKPIINETTIKNEDIQPKDQENNLNQIKEALSEESKFLEEENYEPILELVEDIPGYYESDPNPVFLESTPQKNKQEEKIEEQIENIKEQTVTKENELKNPASLNQSEKKELIIESPKTIEKKEDKLIIEKTIPPTILLEEKNENPPIEISSKKQLEPKINSEKSIETNQDTSINKVKQSELLSTTNEIEDSKEEPTENKIIITPSRSVKMKNNQYLDIVYPGSGWIYLGEENNKNAMRYFGRKIGENNTIFSLRSREEGGTILHFYKNDQLTGKYIDDYLQVEVEGMNDSSEHAIAPSYEDIVPAKPEKKDLLTLPKLLEENKKVDIKKNQEVNKILPGVNKESNSSIQNNQNNSQKNIKEEKPSSVTFDKKDSNANKIETNNNKNISKEKIENSSITENVEQKEEDLSIPKLPIPNTENMEADEILEKAKESFKNKEYEDTLGYLNSFFEKATTKIDEGLILQGQTFETNSSVRNIKSALDTYETIVRRYPQSIHWAKANERITYLRKFYFNIR